MTQEKIDNINRKLEAIIKEVEQLQLEPGEEGNLFIRIPRPSPGPPPENAEIDLKTQRIKLVIKG